MTSIATTPQRKGLLPPYVQDEEFDGLEFEDIAHRIDPEYWQYYPVYPEFLSRADIPEVAKKVYQELLAQLVKEILDEEARELQEWEDAYRNAPDKDVFLEEYHRDCVAKAKAYDHTNTTAKP